MIPVLVAGLAGFVFASRGGPRTRCEKKVVLGARTGRTYDVEEFPDAGFLVARYEGHHGVFQHVQPKQEGEPRFAWRGGRGPAEVLHGMCLDLGVAKERPVPTAVPKAADTSTRKVG